MARLNEGSLALLDNYFDRVRNMDTSAATALSATLAHQLAETMDLAPPEQPETFLREVYLALRERSEGV